MVAAAQGFYGIRSNLMGFVSVAFTQKRYFSPESSDLHLIHQAC
jgi:hypothetical protein